MFAKRHYLKLLMKDYNPVCLALQELNFGNDKHTTDKTYAQYKTFHSKVVGRLGAGLLVRSDIPVRDIPLNTEFKQ